MTEFLLAKGYEVHGVIRRSSSFNTGRINHLYANPSLHKEGGEYWSLLLLFKFFFNVYIIAMKLHYGDLNDSSSLVKIISSVKPHEIYNLGAMSHVKV